MIEIMEMDRADYPLLEEFIYWAIFTPPGAALPARSIVFSPDVFVYIENFGSESDCAVAAKADGKTIGAAWTRIIPAYGHVDDQTPELAISVLPEYRNQSIGTRLMRALFALLAQRGYKQTSLAVQKENPAANFYLRLGYKIISEKPEEYIMIKKLAESDRALMPE